MRMKPYLSFKGQCEAALTFCVCTVALCAAGCEPAVPDLAKSKPATATASVDSGFATVTESDWVTVSGPTLIGFYPLGSKAPAERDEGLSTALDDFSFHLSTAGDSLKAAGFAVELRGGDTLWLRTASDRARIIRAPDSSTIGYLFADTLRHRVILYGVRSNVELVDYAHQFKRSGTLSPR
jgi:hypothetical protein